MTLWSKIVGLQKGEWPAAQREIGDKRFTIQTASKPGDSPDCWLGKYGITVMGCYGTDVPERWN